jgi:hypothetical protein
MQNDEAVARDRRNKASGWSASGQADSLMRASVGDVPQKKAATKVTGPTAAEIAKEEAGLSEAEKKLKRKEREMEAKLKAREQELEDQYNERLAVLEAKTKKQEDELAQREKEMAEKEKLLQMKEADPVLHCNPDVLKPIR